MKRTAIIYVLTVMLIGTVASTARASTEIRGVTGGGAFFLIVVPDAWNGDLVIWNHGFDTTGPIRELTMADLGPSSASGISLADIQLAEGFAVAASSYQQIGWALFKTKNDLQHLVNVFKETFGAPDQIFITGASLGGIVTAAAIEEANLGNVVGAMPICGALAGSRNWDAALDLRLVYDVVCDAASGGAIPGGAEGLPEGVPIDATTRAEVIAAVNACTGVLTPPPYRTAEQIANLEQILDELQLSEGFLLPDMILATLGMSDLVHNPAKLDGEIGTGNVNVDYSDPDIDASIERVSPNPGAKNRLRRHFTPTGEVGDTKIVSLHTLTDDQVLVENESEYASVVPAANLTTAIVDEAAPSHCGFTPAEVVAAWTSLQAWVASDVKPDAEDIQNTCNLLQTTTMLPGPCRIITDPLFEIPDMDGRVPPR